MTKLAIKYLPGVGGEFLMSLISSKILNKPFDLNEKNHYDCTQYDCGHQSFRKVFTHVWFNDVPDYPSLISDSVGKSDINKANIFKNYDRITIHVWTLNIMAEMQVRGFKRLLAVRDYKNKGRKLAVKKLGTLVGKVDIPQDEWHDLIYKKIEDHSENTYMYNYARKAFDIVETDYESLYNNTFKETQTLIRDFSNVEIDQNDFSLMRRYYEKNEAIIAS